MSRSLSQQTGTLLRLRISSVTFLLQFRKSSPKAPAMVDNQRVQEFKGKRVALGVTGGIAAYK
ncbi:MAG TPA: hypothetical protein VKB86_12185, partial [Pyrinomonadaceae bacterium]|nr:hypothetical protein [Pyrinomonadaceae bacterium]